MKKKKLIELDTGELEKRQAISEIRSKRFYLQPSFWTFLIAVGAFIVTWQTGVIDYERIKNQRKSDSLRIEKQRLEVRITSLELREKWLDSVFVKKEDSLITIFQYKVDSLEKIFKLNEDSLINITRRLKEEIAQHENTLYYLLADEILNYFKDSKRLSNPTINIYLKRFKENTSNERKQVYIDYFTNKINKSENTIFKLRLLAFLDILQKDTIWFEKYCNIVLNTKIENGNTLLNDFEAMWSSYNRKLYTQELKFVLYDGILSTGKNHLNIEIDYRSIYRFGLLNKFEYELLSKDLKK